MPAHLQGIDGNIFSVKGGPVLLASPFFRYCLIHLSTPPNTGTHHNVDANWRGCQS
ncbi:hypothetical protein PPEP_b1052 [Pseudoalteromonas peptidolytica F12-50-A1]|uniref:Uncharacterized protein n=1 Tax=Pseudoalteromonas peptidolytica F12-50-A1 TaxID=1315280 RepID=A0A8I0T777_9GAMM|nr:hypothetical protein [Pseudoalteromonas peptidolytica F12-50-A1]